MKWNEKMDGLYLYFSLDFFNWKQIIAGSDYSTAHIILELCDVDDAWFNHNFSLPNKLYVGNCQCSTYAIELGDQAPMKLPLVLCQNKITWYWCLEQKTSSESKVVVPMSPTTVTRVWFWLHVFDSTHLIILFCIAVSKININFTAPKCYKYWMNIAAVE